MSGMARWRPSTYKRGDGAPEPGALAALREQADAGEAARMVAEASAANLPEGNKTAARYLADPERSFAIREARAGTIEGVAATFVWIGPRGGDGARPGGPGSGTTFAFAALPHAVAWAEAWPRPEWVPVAPDTALGHAAFDERYMIAGDDPARTFTPAVVEAFLAAPDDTFAWATFWGDHVCAHGAHASGADRDNDRLVEFAVSVSRAMAGSA
jgi:hypothetical protein